MWSRRRGPLRPSEKDIIHNNLNMEFLPPVIFGTSGLGNLFVALDEEAKFEIIKECLRSSNGPVVFDTAGKYGAGLALEVLGRCLRSLDISPDQVIISNKLAWVRTKLRTPKRSSRSPA